MSKAVDAEKWAELALIGVGLFLAYKVLTGVSSTVAAAAGAASNFDQNVGLGPFDAWVSSLFAPPGT
jgi:hypothetical protein